MSLMSRRDFRDLRVLCTGASSGIGAALSRELASRGARLVLNARREEQLKELASDIEKAGGEVYLVPGDITEQKTRQSMWPSPSRNGVESMPSSAALGSERLLISPTRAKKFFARSWKSTSLPLLN